MGWNLKADELGKVRILNLIFKPAGMIMESWLRHWILDPDRTLKGAGIEPGQTILEVGSGTGFFTIPAAKMIGGTGSLTAIEPLSNYAKRIGEKVQEAGLKNIH